MITYLLMLLIVVSLVIISLWGIHYSQEKKGFMNVEDSTFLRGFWCIIVLFVHVPELYQNRIQDAVGSFAYIGVTFFFLTSAYGLKRSVEKKSGYIARFWRNRLPSVIIPALIANAIDIYVSWLRGNVITIFSLLNINNWVKVLLILYFVFWLVYSIFPSNKNFDKWRDLLICSIVLAMSLVDYFSDFKITMIWIVEPIGFAYGIMVANYHSKINNWFHKHWIYKTLFFLIISAVLGVAYLKYKTVYFWGGYLLKVLLGVAITSLIFCIISKCKIGNCINSFLGKISYEIYLIHGAVFSVLNIIRQNWISGIYIFVSLLITILLSILLHLICKPIIKIIKK